MLQSATKFVGSSMNAQESKQAPKYDILAYFEVDLMTIMHRAHETYLEEMKKKEDGRPDFAARKACNYLEEAIEVM